MLASEYNPTVQRGGTFSVGISAVDEGGNPRDFSGYDSMRLHVRPAWVGKPGTVKAEPLLSLSTEGAQPEIVITTNLITITIIAEVTAAFTFNSGKYELEMITDEIDINNPEIVDKLLFGTMYITGEIVV